MMANLENTLDPCVMVVEPNVKVGRILADWLGRHGYQAVLVRSVEEAIGGLRDSRPQMVFVGDGHSEPSAQSEISEILRLIQTVSPGVSMITIAGQTSTDQTPAVPRQEVADDQFKRD